MSEAANGTNAARETPDAAGAGPSDALAPLEDLPRQGASTLDGYLITIGDPEPISGLTTRMRTHLVARDVNGMLQTRKLAELLADLVTDYCIPVADRRVALEQVISTGSDEALNALRREAVELFVDNDRSGEAGEMLLYLLTERILGAPQIISKMALKTARQMHYHGADGVHVKRTERGIALYWGESKIHKDRATAVRECLESVAPYLTDTDRSTAMRDLRLVRSNLDMEGKELRNALTRYFIQRNPEWNSLEFRASCLVGFDHSDYPSLSTIGQALDPAVKATITEWLDHVRTHVEAKSLQTFEVDVFMVPFISVDDFRQQMLAALGVR